MMTSTRFSVPIFVQELLKDVSPEQLLQVEEIRIRQNQPVELILNGQSFWLSKTGQVTSQAALALKLDEKRCRALLDQLTNHSVYSFEEQLRRGFITAEGGHRVGLAGTVSLHDGRVKFIREVTSFNVRLARQMRGVASRLLPWLYDVRKQRFYQTLIVSPPQQGKTTFLRDLARLASNGFRTLEGREVMGQKVAIVDERSEIAACLHGVPQFDVGVRTDVLDQCPKAEGMMMMIRSMSPQLLIVDEIGREEDVDAVQEAMLAGVTLFASAHASHLHEVMQRPILRPLAEHQRFERYVCIERKSGTHTFLKIYDQQARCVTTILESSAGKKSC